MHKNQLVALAHKYRNEVTKELEDSNLQSGLSYMKGEAALDYYALTDIAIACGNLNFPEVQSDADKAKDEGE